MTRYGVVIFAREKKDTVHSVLLALSEQTIKPLDVVFVDDGCEGNVSELVENMGFRYVRYPEMHEESWAGRPELAKVVNFGLKNLDLPSLDFFMILGGDTVLEREYAEKVIDKMKRNEKIVIASGYVVSEGKTRAPRGTGRFYRVKWWLKYLREFPIAYSWESYPLYLAMAEGYEVAVVDAKMYVKRKTKRYKPTYGRAMRELGYWPPYALARIALAITRNPVVGLKMLYTYITSPCEPINKRIASFIRDYQKKRAKELIKKCLGLC